MIEEEEGRITSQGEVRGARGRTKGKRHRLLDHQDRYLRTTQCQLEAAGKVRVKLVRSGLTSMSEASLVRRRAGNPNLRGARWKISRGGLTRVGRQLEVWRMVCKGSTCKG